MRREARASRGGLTPVSSTAFPDVADADPERVPFFDDLRPYMILLLGDGARRELLLEAAAFFRGRDGARWSRSGGFRPSPPLPPRSPLGL